MTAALMVSQAELQALRFVVEKVAAAYLSSASDPMGALDAWSADAARMTKGIQDRIAREAPAPGVPREEIADEIRAMGDQIQQLLASIRQSTERRMVSGEFGA